MSDSFYVPVGDGAWQATVHTAGPWDSSAQHGGPPSALLGRAMLRFEEKKGWPAPPPPIPARFR